MAYAYSPYGFDKLDRYMGYKSQAGEPFAKNVGVTAGPGGPTSIKRAATPQGAGRAALEAARGSNIGEPLITQNAVDIMSASRSGHEQAGALEDEEGNLFPTGGGYLGPYTKETGAGYAGPTQDIKNTLYAGDEPSFLRLQGIMAGGAPAVTPMPSLNATLPSLDYLKNKEATSEAIKKTTPEEYTEGEQAFDRAVLGQSTPFKQQRQGILNFGGRVKENLAQLPGKVTSEAQKRRDKAYAEAKDIIRGVATETRGEIRTPAEQKATEERGRRTPYTPEQKGQFTPNVDIGALTSAVPGISDENIQNALRDVSKEPFYHLPQGPVEWEQFVTSGQTTPYQRGGTLLGEDDWRQMPGLQQFSGDPYDEQGYMKALIEYLRALPRETPGQGGTPPEEEFPRAGDDGREKDGIPFPEDPYQKAIDAIRSQGEAGFSPQLPGSQIPDPIFGYGKGKPFTFDAHEGATLPEYMIAQYPAPAGLKWVTAGRATKKLVRA